MLTNPKPAGWNTGDPITDTQINLFGTQMPKAVDGDGGGTYANSPIELSGTLTVGGLATKSTGAHSLAGTLTVASGATLALASGASGSANSGSTLSLNGTTNIGGTMTVGTNAKITGRLQKVNNTSVTCYATTCDDVLSVCASTVRTIHLSTSGAANGDSIHVAHNGVGPGSVIVYNDGPINNTLASFTSGSFGWIRSSFDGTDWLKVAGS
jgi:hypothetical protein